MMRARLNHCAYWIVNVFTEIYVHSIEHSHKKRRLDGIHQNFNYYVLSSELNICIDSKNKLLFICCFFVCCLELQGRISVVRYGHMLFAGGEVAVLHQYHTLLIRKQGKINIAIENMHGAYPLS